MHILHHLLKIRQCPELRVHIPVIPHAIIAAEATLTVFDPDRVHGHKPADTDTQFLQARQMLSKCLYAAFGRVLAQIHLVQLAKGQKRWYGKWLLQIS